jgi:hypothetical protein
LTPLLNKAFTTLSIKQVNQTVFFGGIGVHGIAKEHAPGVLGVCDTRHASGVEGFNANREGPAHGVTGTAHSFDGAGVNGISEKGYGGIFSGHRAPLRLVPADTPGPPTSELHQRGELYVDSNGELFYCKDDGNPGNWHRVLLK